MLSEFPHQAWLGCHRSPASPPWAPSTSSCQGGSPHGSGGMLRADSLVSCPPQNPAPPPLLTLLPLASFQVPWFETIPVAVSNDISEQSLEEFSREVR